MCSYPPRTGPVFVDDGDPDMTLKSTCAHVSLSTRAMSGDLQWERSHTLKAVLIEVAYNGGNMFHSLGSIQNSEIRVLCLILIESAYHF